MDRLECSVEENIHKLCCDDLLGIPVEAFSTVYERVYQKPLSSEHIRGYTDVADFIRSEMSNILTEVELKGRPMFLPKSRATEFLKKRPEDFKLVEQKLPSRNQFLLPLPKTGPLRRPKASIACQTSHGELAPSETGFETRSEISDDRSPPSSPVALAVGPVSQSEKTLVTNGSDDSDDETRSIMDDDLNAEFSSSISVFKQALRSSYPSKSGSRNAGLEYVSLREQDFFSGWRAPKCGSVMDFTDSDDSDSTVNGDQESPDSGHDSPDNSKQLSEIDPNLCDKSNYEVALDLLKKLPMYRMNRRKQLTSEISKLQETVTKLQAELKSIQRQAQADLLLTARVENYLQTCQKESDKDITALDSILTENDEKLLLENLVKTNAKLIQDILNGQDVDLSKVKLPSNYSAVGYKCLS